MAAQVGPNLAVAAVVVVERTKPAVVAAVVERAMPVAVAAAVEQAKPVVAAVVAVAA